MSVVGEITYVSVLCVAGSGSGRVRVFYDGVRAAADAPLAPLARHVQRLAGVGEEGPLTLVSWAVPR